MEDRIQVDRQEGDGRLLEIVKQIADDVKTIAHDEVELAKLELQNTAKRAATDAAVTMLGGIVALIGIGLLCVSAVDALEPAIPQLWLRLIIMAIVYVVTGAVLFAVFGRRLGREVNPDIHRVTAQAGRMVDPVRQGIKSAGNQKQLTEGLRPE